MNISVLGCGRWGSCIAWYLDKIGNNVISCGLADAPEFIQLSTTHKNDYLTFPESIEVTSDLAKAVNHAEVIVISISSQHLRSYMQSIAQNNLDGKTIVLCMKGVEAAIGTGRFRNPGILPAECGNVSGIQSVHLRLRPLLSEP